MRAIALLSGGLDSTLALRMVLGQGIEVEAVNFFTPFCRCNRKRSGCGYEAKKVTDRLGVKLKIFNLGAEYLQIIENPKFGYGRNLNPCIDCRILMHKKAKEYMQTGALFIITGEVLGQRPMSQHRQALKTIERESGLEGLVLRPLSAKKLPLTIPEKEGWVNREKLLEITGRSRKAQMALAREFELGDYPCPAGGCLLTDPVFSQRMRDLMAHSNLNLEDIELLKVGRHFRLSPSCKVIIGRNQQENEKLLRLTKTGDICFRPQEVKGPFGLGRGSFDETAINLTSRIMARYSDNGRDGVKIAIDFAQGEMSFVTATNNISDDQLQTLRI